MPLRRDTDLPSMPAVTHAIVRPEEPRDQAAVRAVNQAAFGRPGEVAGHILFSPVTLEPLWWGRLGVARDVIRYIATLGRVLVERKQ